MSAKKTIKHQDLSLLVEFMEQKALPLDLGWNYGVTLQPPLDSPDIRHAFARYIHFDDEGQGHMLIRVEEKVTEKLPDGSTKTSIIPYGTWSTISRLANGALDIQPVGDPTKGQCEIVNPLGGSKFIMQFANAELTKFHKAEFNWHPVAIDRLAKMFKTAGLNPAYMNIGLTMDQLDIPEFGQKYDIFLEKNQKGYINMVEMWPHTGETRQRANAPQESSGNTIGEIATAGTERTAKLLANFRKKRGSKS